MISIKLMQYERLLVLLQLVSCRFCKPFDHIQHLFLGSISAIQGSARSRCRLSIAGLRTAEGFLSNVSRLSGRLSQLLKMLC